MSNWLKSKCNTLENIEAQYMNDAFARMGMYADFETHEVERTYERDKRPCQALLRNLATGASERIGLNFNITTNEAGKQLVTMTAEADWWGLKYHDKSFLERFTIEYIAVKSIATARAQGFRVKEEVTMQDGRRRLVMCRAA